MIDMDKKKIKKTIFLGVFAIVVALILNGKCSPSYAVFAGGYYPGGSETINFGYKEATYDCKVYMTGKIISGNITVYLLDGDFDFDNDFTEEDIIEKHIMESGEYNLLIYVGDTSPYHKKTVWIDFSKDFEYSRCKIMSSTRRKLIEYIMEGLLS